MKMFLGHMNGRLAQVRSHNELYVGFTRVIRKKKIEYIFKR